MEGRYHLRANFQVKLLNLPNFLGTKLIQISSLWEQAQKSFYFSPDQEEFSLIIVFKVSPLINYVLNRITTLYILDQAAPNKFTALLVSHD